MADLTKTIEVVFMGDNRISSVVDNVKKSFKSLDNSIASVTGPLAQLASSIEKAETALAAMAAGGMALAIKEAGDFHDSFSEINSLAGTTGQSMENFKNSILDYAQGSTQSIDDIDSAIYQAVSLGVKYQDSIAAVSTSEKLAVAGRSDLTSTTELLIGTMNAYGASMDEAQKYSDALFTTVKDGKTTIPELSQSLAQVTNLAAAADVPFNTLSAALAALTSAGMPTDEAVTAIKAAITNIIHPSSQAAKMAEQLGIQFNATALQTKGLDGVLKEVEKATGGNVEQMSALFNNVRGLAAALALGADSSGKFAKSLKDMKNDTGATNTAFEEMSKNIGLAVKNLINNIRVDLVGAGEPLLDQFVGDVSGMSDVLKSIKLGFDEGAFDPLFNALNGAGAELETWLEDVAKALPDALEGIDWSVLINSVKDLGHEIGNAFTDLFGNLDLTKPKDLEEFIQKLIDGISGLTNVTAGIVQGWEPFLSMLGKALDHFESLDDSSKKTAGDFLGIGQAVNKLLGPLEAIGKIFDTVGTSLAVIAASSAIKTFTSLPSAVSGGSAALTTFSGILEQSIGSASAGSTFGVMGLGYAIGYAAGTLLDKFVPGIHDASQAVADWLANILGIYDAQGATNSALKTTNDILDKMRTKFGDIGAQLDDLSSKDLVNLKVAFDTSGLDIDEVNAAFDKLPKEKQIKVIADIKSGNYQAAIDELNAIPDSKVIAVDASNVKPLEDKLRKLGLKIRSDIPDEKLIEMGYEVDETGAKKFVKQTDAAVEQAKAKLKELDNQTLEIKAKIQIANIQAQAAEIKQAYQSMAQIQVAQVQSDAKRVEAAFSSVGDTVKSVTDLIGTMTNDFTSTTDQGKAGQIWMWMNDQLKNQDKALQMQQKLTSAQIDYMQARTDAMNRGDSMITVEAPGLKPELEAFMWKILEAIQLRATEEAADFLLGLPTSGITTPAGT